MHVQSVATPMLCRYSFHKIIHSYCLMFKASWFNKLRLTNPCSISYWWILDLYIGFMRQIFICLRTFLEVSFWIKTFLKIKMLCLKIDIFFCFLGAPAPTLVIIALTGLIKPKSRSNMKIFSWKNLHLGWPSIFWWTH